MTTKRGLKIYRDENKDIYEIGIDEAGRGPMFGRVYVAAVILPKENEIFSHEELRDSKKFTSLKKLNKTADYIKENAIAWSVTYKDEKVIDKINIRQATLEGMHDSISNIIDTFRERNKFCLLVDGNDFKPYMTTKYGSIDYIPHTCYEGGDNKFTAIAAASILAKTARDNYILDLCEKNPDLKEKYSIDTNKGYGTAKHMEGIKKYGITEWHRKSYGICKNF